mmetsp:Transcript_1293/g.1802  ORF Transcript_1293/g.1802 Transcript_1293/m.1802 type:complete len:124 (-) Transcript_1293:272-643(-)
MSLSFAVTDAVAGYVCSVSLASTFMMILETRAGTFFRTCVDLASSPTLIARYALVSAALSTIHVASKATYSHDFATSTTFQHYLREKGFQGPAGRNGASPIAFKCFHAGALALCASCIAKERQ